MFVPCSEGFCQTCPLGCFDAVATLGTTYREPGYVDGLVFCSKAVGVEFRPLTVDAVCVVIEAGGSSDDGQPFGVCFFAR